MASLVNNASGPIHEPPAMATQNQFQLLRQRRFAPFFWTQFLGAGNDNVYKNALVIFVAYHAAATAALDANTLVNLAAGLFILPFVVLSATAGQIADKYEKSRLIRFIKVLEIGIMIVGAVGFYLHSLFLLFAALLLMGVHSTLFGPVKYAILPQTLRPEELVGGNGMVEMGTFVAILLGTIAGGVLVAIPGVGPVLAGATAIAVAVAGWLVSRAIPVTPGRRAGPRAQLEPGHRDVEEPALRLRHARGVALDARHLVVLVLRRDVPHAVPQLRQGHPRRRRARGDVPARAVLGRHRRRLAPVRAPVGPQGRDRPRAFRLHRARRSSPSTCGLRRATCTPRASSASRNSWPSPGTCAWWRTSC